MQRPSLGARSDGCVSRPSSKRYFSRHSLQHSHSRSSSRVSSTSTALTDTRDSTPTSKDQGLFRATSAKHRLTDQEPSLKQDPSTHPKQTPISSTTKTGAVSDPPTYQIDVAESLPWGSSKRRRTLPARHFPTNRGYESRQYLHHTNSLSVSLQCRQLQTRSSSLDRGKTKYGRTWSRHSFEPRQLDPDWTFLESTFPVLETNAGSIASLWSQVRVAEMDQNHGLTDLRKTRSSTKAASEAGTIETTGSGRGTRRKRQNTIRIGPYDPQFRTEILAPRGIVIRMDSSVRTDAHFQTDMPDGKRSRYYNEARGAVVSPLWLELEDSAIETCMGIYTCYEREGLVEAEFATYAKEALFKMDPLAILPAKIDPLATVPAKSRCWRARRMVELVAKPDESAFWSMPPPVENSVPSTNMDTGTYEFDIRPDCSYWLSVQGFNPDYVHFVSEWCMVMKGSMICPYLTVEFKKDGALGEAAENQVAAAGSIALYNRFCLKARRVEKTKATWTTEYLQNVKHYGITMKGASFIIWSLTPVVNPSFQWAGCNMTRVSQGSCTLNIASVQCLFNWINEIHCWGLTIHGPECENDIKLSMRTDSSAPRVSDIAMVIKEGYEKT